MEPSFIEGNSSGEDNEDGGGSTITSSTMGSRSVSRQQQHQQDFSSSNSTSDEHRPSLDRDNSMAEHDEDGRLKNLRRKLEIEQDVRKGTNYAIINSPNMWSSCVSA